MATRGKVNVRSRTVYDAEIWGRENVYIFPENVDLPRGVLWVIPPPNMQDVRYKDNPGFPGQHFAYDMTMNALENGDIPQDDFICVIMPTSETSLDQASDMAVKTEIFKTNGFDYHGHIDLCGCCTDQSDREYLNVVYAMGDGASEVDFTDPTVTNVMLIDPIIYPPIEIPEEFASQVSMIANSNNHDPSKETGTAALESQQQILSALPADNVIDTNDPNFDFFNLASIGFAALNLLAGLADSLGNLGPKEDLPWEDHQEPPWQTSSISTKPYPENKNTPVEPVAPQTQRPGDYEGPQVIITSDRILINSKTDDVRISANANVGISALGAVGIDTGGDSFFRVNSPEIYLGLDAVEPLILGQELHDWAASLVDAIKLLTYTNSGGPTGPAINASTLDVLKSDFTWDFIKSDQNYTL